MEIRINKFVSQYKLPPIQQVEICEELTIFVLEEANSLLDKQLMAMEDAIAELPEYAISSIRVESQAYLLGVLCQIITIPPVTVPV